MNIKKQFLIFLCLFFTVSKSTTEKAVIRRAELHNWMAVKVTNGSSEPIKIENNGTCTKILSQQSDCFNCRCLSEIKGAERLSCKVEIIKDKQK